MSKANQSKISSVRIRVTVSALLGLVAALVAWWAGLSKLAPLAGWDVAALTFLAWAWGSVSRMDSKQTASHAVQEDPGRATTDILVLGASVASLVAVAVLLLQTSQSNTKLLHALVGIVSVVIAWSVVHTIFMLKYARLYYDGKPGGIDFNMDKQPSYQDFAYMAFTIGMTFQVSDTSINDQRIRATIIRHALLSYLFGTVIVATSINLIAGLSK